MDRLGLILAHVAAFLFAVAMLCLAFGAVRWSMHGCTDEAGAHVAPPLGITSTE